MAGTTRRAAFGAIGSIAAAGLIAGHATRAASNPDAEIEAAFERRQAAYSTYNALADGPLVEARDAECWAIIDEAEELIRKAVAHSPRGVMIQLWCAIHHDLIRSDQDEAIIRGDFAALDKDDANLNWSTRLLLAALRSLQVMEA